MANNIAMRISEREDNVYDKNVITKIIDMYIEEMIESLKRGEKVKIKGLGTIMPKTKVRRYFSPCLSDEVIDGYLPSVVLRLSTTRKLKEKLDSTFRANIKKGYAGFSEDCMCTPYQKAILIENGLLQEEAVDDYGEDDN